MTDRDFLAWLHARLLNIHGEPASVDFMHRLRGIIASTPEDQQSKPAAELPVGHRAVIVRGRVSEADIRLPATERLFILSRLAEQCGSKRDRECLYRLAKEVCIIDQDFESAVALRALQTANRPRLPKGHRHAARR